MAWADADASCHLGAHVTAAALPRQVREASKGPLRDGMARCGQASVAHARPPVLDFQGRQAVKQTEQHVHT